MYKLIIQDDEGKTTVVPLIRDEITIGRKEGNTIRLTERNVSRRHARIVKSNGSVVVEDLESYNGVKVNGTRIQGRVAVGETDRIQIGDYLLELKVDRGQSDVYPPGQAPPGISGSGSFGPPSPAGMAMGPQSMGSMPPSPVAGSNGAHPAAMASASAQQVRAAQAGKVTQPMPVAYENVPTPMAMAETVPEPAPGAGVVAPPSQPGRLVVVSSNFGGREFQLDKPAMVIGRTDDNDVVINHRSISRHHAKIVLEQGRYCIVDMQSSNGVRVNGEEYGKVELRRGDMIDLGHVRLRYVEPGEDFVFDRDAQLVDVATRSGKGNKAALWAGLSVILVGAVVAVVFVTQKDGSAPMASTPTTTVVPAPTAPAATAPATTPEPAPPAPQPDPAPVPVAAAASPDAGAVATAVPATPPEAPKPDPTRSLDATIGEARKALEEERWVAAVGAAEEVIKADPAHAEAKAIQERANREFRHQTTYEKVVKARDANRAVEVARLAREIPDGSVYHARAQADLEKMRDGYVKEREAEARALAARGQCDRIGGLARRAGEVFAEARAAVERAGKDCTPVAAAPKAAPEGTPPAPKTLTNEQVTELLVSAKEAARASNWNDARKKSEDVLRARPDDMDAVSVAAMAACNLGDHDRAVRYIEKMKGERKNQMRQICASRGVLIDP
jgi:pSer/pThr/pTyr-binding forkhead associated (FHA) protein